jgi:hypothetical protein
VLEHGDAVGGERREIAGVEVGRAHQRGVTHFVGEPPCDRARAGADLEAPRSRAYAGGLDRRDAHGIGLYLEQLQSFLLALEVLW